MAFCKFCGKQIEEGKVCGCQTSTKPIIDKERAKGFIESMKNRMGIGEPERNATDTYERGMNIVPDCIKPIAGEVPIKQYNVAVLRNVLRYERAEGRMQVTNKRVVFRAAGRSIGGRTALQQEFGIDKLAGVESQRNYRFGFVYLLVGILVTSIAMLLSVLLFSNINGALTRMRVDSYQSQMKRLSEQFQQESQRAEERYLKDMEGMQDRYSDNWDRMQAEINRIDEQYQSNLQKRNEKYDEDSRRLQRNTYNENGGIFFVVRLIIGFAGLAIFFTLYKKFLLKLAILGVSCGAVTLASITSMQGILGGRYSSGGFNPGILLLPFLIVIIFGLVLYSLKPNLAIIIKTKSGLDISTPIKIQRSRGFWAIRQDGGTGFSEVFPTEESESAIREIGALINDINILGDQGMAKWREK